MLNDNTHTRKWLTVDELSNFIRIVDGNHDKGAGAIAEELLPMIEARLPSTPAEPKAGDWEKELEDDHVYDVYATDPQSTSGWYRALYSQGEGFLIGEHPNARILSDVKIVRALSSAAPRITERGMNEDWWSEAVDTYFAEHADGKREMPPGAYLRRHWEEDTGYWCNELVHIRQGEDWTTGDIDTMWIGPFPEWVFNGPAPLSGITEEMVEGILDGIRVRGNTDRHHGIRTGIEKAKVAMIALLRQQGAERKWIGVDERLPEKNTPIFIRWGDEKASPDTSNLKDSRVASTRILHLMRLGKIGWWCERRVFVDTPPPFTPTQTEE